MFEGTPQRSFAGVELNDNKCLDLQKATVSLPQLF